jgi:3,4-dihydroxy 2-butanone 4-phosphate synthase/GTP cyclohydrolase II
MDHNDNHHVAFVFKKEGQSLQNVRFHNIGTDLELFTKYRYESIMKSVEILKNEGGALIFLEKASNENPYMKEYGIGAQILRYLGFRDIKLLVTQRKREFVGISGFGLNVAEEREL